MQKNMVKSFAALHGGRDKDIKVVCYPLLALEIGEGERTELFLKIRITGQCCLFSRVKLFGHKY
jgi:hypothetical protein